MIRSIKEPVSVLGGIATGAGASWGTLAFAASGATTATGASLAGGAAVTTALCGLGGSIIGGVVVIGAISAGATYGAYRGIKAILGLLS